VTVPMLRPANDDDRDLLDRLWLMFRHDMSEFNGALPSADGTFRSEALQEAVVDPGSAAFIVELDDHAVGLVIVRALDKPVRVLSRFFVVRGARRLGVGQSSVRQLLDLYPGRWTVAFQTANTAAGAFWRKVAALSSAEWIEERRPVPVREDLPGDTWIEFSG
jgi:predicted acetyltransferase